jgi:hypothetical protein
VRHEIRRLFTFGLPCGAQQVGKYRVRLFEILVHVLRATDLDIGKLFRSVSYLW